jgi:hypothetical protein
MAGDRKPLPPEPEFTLMSIVLAPATRAFVGMLYVKVALFPR